MPSVTQYRERTVNYGTRQAYDYTNRNLYSSTAYDIPVSYPKRTAQPKPAQKAQTPAVNKGLVRLGLVFLALVAICFTVVSRYAIILESNQKITSLEKQYEQMLSSNQVLQTKIDKGIEMGEIERYAKSELGMMRPENHQLFYIDIEMEDLSSKKTNSAGKSHISGTPGALVNAFGVLK